MGMDAFVRLGLRSTSKQRRSKLSLSNFESVRGVHRKEGFLASTGRGGTGLMGFGSGGGRNNTRAQGGQGQGQRQGQGQGDGARSQSHANATRRSDEQFDRAHHEADDYHDQDQDLLSVIEEADSMMSASHVGLLAPLQVTPTTTTTTTIQYNNTITTKHTSFMFYII